MLRTLPKGKTVFLKLDDIVLDQSLYPRIKRGFVDPETVERYMEAMKDGVVFPPIKVSKRTMHLIDGLHRFTAAKKLGWKTIEAELIDIPEDKEWLYAIQANVKNGLPFLKNEVKEYVRKKFIEEGRSWSKEKVKEVAEAVGRTERTIYNWIQDLYTQKKTHKLSEEEKQKIIELKKQGKGAKKIAKETGLSVSSVQNIMQRSKKSTESETISLSVPSSEEPPVIDAREIYKQKGVEVPEMEETEPITEHTEEWQVEGKPKISSKEEKEIKEWLLKDAEFMWKMGVISDAEMEAIKLKLENIDLSKEEKEKLERAKFFGDIILHIDEIVWIINETWDDAKIAYIEMKLRQANLHPGLLYSNQAEELRNAGRFFYELADLYEKHFSNL